jgi:hypothetical protein
LELMHEFMEFYRMDYTCNVFVHESNYKATTERQALGIMLSFSEQTELGSGRLIKAFARFDYR